MAKPIDRGLETIDDRTARGIRAGGTDSDNREGTGRNAEDTRFIILSEQELRSFHEKSVEIGVKEALRCFQQEQRKESGKRADRRLRNTRLLLRNFRMLKEHAENSVFSREQMGESALEILESMMMGKDDGVAIDSIRRSAVRTAVIVAHVEAMLEIYKAFCEKSAHREAEKRRYEVMHDMYLADPVLTVDEEAAKWNMSERNVYKDLGMAVERLSALFFGVDGLKYQ